MNFTGFEKRILVIDDSADMRMLLSCLLQSQGYLAETSPNGREALIKLKSATVLPDVILLDLRMPELDGKGFIDVQRRIPKLQKIPVVIMSGDDESQFAEERLVAIKKPFAIDSLLELVGRISA